MKDAVTRHATTILVAMVTAAVTAGGPVVARTVVDYARDANRVDGKHAVSAGASRSTRAGKLVATGSGGFLPNNIILKAPNADRLDGFNSPAFARSVAPSGSLQRGEFGTEFRSAGAVTINFPTPLARGLASNRVHFIADGAPFTNACRGPGRALRGHLCLYEHHNYNSSPNSDPSTSIGGVLANGTSRFGFVVPFGTFDDTELSRSYGEWVLRAP